MKRTTKKQKRPADNKRFGEMAAGVIAQAAVMWETVSDSSSGVQLNPPLRQAAPTLPASLGYVGPKSVK